MTGHTDDNHGQKQLILTCYENLKQNIEICLPFVVEIDSCRGNHQARYPAVLYLRLLYLLPTLLFWLQLLMALSFIKILFRLLESKVQWKQQK